MDLKEKYNEFYNKKIRNANEVEKKYMKLLKTKISDLDLTNEKIDLSLAIIEDKIASISSLKTNYINIYYKFLDYLKSQNIKCSCGFSKSYLTETRRIELIKYFQEAHTEEQVLKDFMIKNRTFRSDLKALEDGIDFCGTKLKIIFNKYDRDGKITIDDKGYHSSYNPFGLVLNMSELYLLTNIIPKMLKNYDINREYCNIINKIYPQLSDYAQDLMENKYFNQYIPREEFILESKLMKDSAINQLSFVSKAGKICSVMYKVDGGICKVEGRVRVPYNEDSFIVKKEDGTKEIILFEDFLGIENFFDEVYE